VVRRSGDPVLRQDGKNNFDNSRLRLGTAPKQAVPHLSASGVALLARKQR